MTDYKNNMDKPLKKYMKGTGRSASGAGTSRLRGDCAVCFGLCCAALYYSGSEGFPSDKEAGVPCPDLLPDFRCGVYNRVINRELRGCRAFDCFGAGQKVCRTTFGGNDWRNYPETRLLMFDVFQVMRQLHEMLWYLTDAMRFEAAANVLSALKEMVAETEQITLLCPELLVQWDVDAHRAIVNDLLIKTSKLVRANARGRQQNQSLPRRNFKRGADLAGIDLRKYDMRGANLRGACLIAADLRGVDLEGADLIGADFRDADISGADLSEALFLTQVQVNQARGEKGTRLPGLLDRPSHWA